MKLLNEWKSPLIRWKVCKMFVFLENENKANEMLNEKGVNYFF